VLAFHPVAQLLQRGSPTRRCGGEDGQRNPNPGAPNDREHDDRRALTGDGRPNLRDGQPGGHAQQQVFGFDDGEQYAEPDGGSHVHVVELLHPSGPLRRCTGTGAIAPLPHTKPDEQHADEQFEHAHPPCWPTFAAGVSDVGEDGNTSGNDEQRNNPGGDVRKRRGSSTVAHQQRDHRDARERAKCDADRKCKHCPDRVACHPVAPIRTSLRGVRRRRAAARDATPCGAARATS
jgi:hypothetical protein